MWCKLCAKYKDEILSKLKGSVKESAASFINGTSVVSKYQVRDTKVYSIICINLIPSTF